MHSYSAHGYLDFVRNQHGTGNMTTKYRRNIRNITTQVSRLLEHGMTQTVRLRIQRPIKNKRIETGYVV